MSLRVTAVAHPNLAFVKYWGKADAKLNIPANDSISVNLNGATTTTSVVFVPGLERDEVTLNGAALSGVAAGEAAAAKVSAHLDRVRRLAGIDARARVASANDFPMAAGIASSASAFAALSLAASRAAGLQLDERVLSMLARKGSGSACRSIPAGFARWHAGDSDETSFADQIAPPDHWDLCITTVIFSEQPKEIASSEGQAWAPSSPFFAARLAALPDTLDTVQAALLARDFHRFGAATEREAVSMHAVAMTAQPVGREWLTGALYWQPATVFFLHQVAAWRRGGLPVYLTIDAGPNVHLLCEGKHQAALAHELDGVLPAWGGRTMVSRPGGGAWVAEESEV
jgi:diphosphomevalonate decarboxylase